MIPTKVLRMLAAHIHKVEYERFLGVIGDTEADRNLYRLLCAPELVEIIESANYRVIMEQASQCPLPGMIAGKWIDTMDYSAPQSVLAAEPEDQS